MREGSPACWLDYQWQSEGRVLLLRQVFIERKPAVLIFTLTTTPEDAPRHETGWRRVMGTLKLAPNRADPEKDPDNSADDSA